MLPVLWSVGFYKKLMQRNVDAGYFWREPKYATRSEAECCVLRQVAENFKFKYIGFDQPFIYRLTLLVLGSVKLYIMVDLKQNYFKKFQNSRKHAPFTSFTPRDCGKRSKFAKQILTLFEI